MAKKKSKKKSGARRGKSRRRVGAASAMEETLLMAGAAIAGGIIAPFAVNALDTAAAGKVPLAVTRTAVTAVGGVTAVMGDRNPLLKGLGFGIATVAGVMTINELGLNVPGIAGIPAVGAARNPRLHSRRRMNGIRAVGDAITTGNPTRKAMGIGALYAN